MKASIIRRPISDIPHLDTLNPILRRVYCARQIQSMEDLSRELRSLLPTHLLKNIDKAVQRIAIALQKQQNILIIGDFDADGATSTALVVSVFEQIRGGR